jgi:hypothetical protein
MGREPSIGQAAGMVASDFGFANAVPENPSRTPKCNNHLGKLLPRLERKWPMTLRLKWHHHKLQNQYKFGIYSTFRHT